MKWKSYCSANTCTGCNSLNIVQSAKRWCYEDRFSLKRQDEVIRARMNGKDTHIMTNIIGYQTHKGGHSGESNNCEWEKNFESPYRERPDNYIHLMQEVCKTLGVDFKRFMKTLDKIRNEMGVLADDTII